MNYSQTLSINKPFYNFLRDFLIARKKVTDTQSLYPAPSSFTHPAPWLASANRYQCGHTRPQSPQLLAFAHAAVSWETSSPLSSSSAPALGCHVRVLSAESLPCLESSGNPLLPVPLALTWFICHYSYQNPCHDRLGNPQQTIRIGKTHTSSPDQGESMRQPPYTLF